MHRSRSVVRESADEGYDSKISQGNRKTGVPNARHIRANACEPGKVTPTTTLQRSQYDR